MIIGKKNEVSLYINNLRTCNPMWTIWSLEIIVQFKTGKLFLSCMFSQYNLCCFCVVMQELSQFGWKAWGRWHEHPSVIMCAICVEFKRGVGGWVVMEKKWGKRKEQLLVVVDTTDSAHDISGMIFLVLRVCRAWEHICSPLRCRCDLETGNFEPKSCRE